MHKSYHPIGKNIIMTVFGSWPTCGSVGWSTHHSYPQEKVSQFSKTTSAQHCGVVVNTCSFLHGIIALWTLQRVNMFDPPYKERKLWQVNSLTSIVLRSIESLKQNIIFRLTVEKMHNCFVQNKYHNLRIFSFYFPYTHLLWKKQTIIIIRLMSSHSINCGKIHDLWHLVSCFTKKNTEQRQFFLETYNFYTFLDWNCIWVWDSTNIYFVPCLISFQCRIRILLRVLEFPNKFYATSRTFYR